MQQPPLSVHVQQEAARSVPADQAQHWGEASALRQRQAVCPTPDLKCPMRREAFDWILQADYVLLPHHVQPQALVAQADWMLPPPS